jgi:hypothetical protein
MAELIALGLVKTKRMVTMGNPQPSPKDFTLVISMDAVHRLDVGGWK